MTVRLAPETTTPSGRVIDSAIESASAPKPVIVIVLTCGSDGLRYVRHFAPRRSQICPSTKRVVSDADR